MIALAVVAVLSTSHAAAPHPPAIVHAASLRAPVLRGPSVRWPALPVRPWPLPHEGWQRYWRLGTPASNLGYQAPAAIRVERVVLNPLHRHHWSWRHGVIWYPVPVYWGGGFWGSWIAGANTLPLFGSIPDYYDGDAFPSYLVGDDTPGAQLLADYGLTQAACGQPNLVVIWGPENSVICAYPNERVAAGNYEVEPETLALRALDTAP